jgi:hypothetical protein
MALHLKVVNVCSVLNGYLERRTRLTRLDDISVEFAFCGSNFVRGVKGMYLKVRHAASPAGTCALKGSLYVEAVIAIRVQQHFPQHVKESVFDLDRGPSWRNGKPCTIAAYYFLPGKPERKSARAPTR